MKFTKFALASVAAFGLAGVASAENLVADGLESWEDLNKSPQTGYSVDGTESEAGQNAVWFGGKDGDETKVMAYAAEGAPAAYSGKRPGDLDAANNNYLKVSNSDPLWRMINKYSKDEMTGDWPTPFPAEDNTNVEVGDGLFVDTLVQFTPSEDVPDVEEGSKLIVWMNSESNLCVTASKIITEGDDEGTIAVTNFVTSKQLKANTWYRLTVKAYDTVLSDGASRNVHAFKVLIDGKYVSSDDAVAGDDEFNFFPLMKDELEDALAAGEVFFSLSDDSTATLAAVGFKGEGLVDDIVVTDVDPFPSGAPAGGIDFTLTWGEGVSAVWYAIDGVESEATKGEEIELEDGEEFAITRATPEAWYTIDPASTNAAPVDGETYTVTATAAATAGAAGVTDEALANWTVAQVKAAFGDTVTPAAIEDADAPYLDYQFGQDLGTLSEAPDVKITDIAETAGGWDITVQMFKGTDALDIETGTGSEGSKTIKAALKVKQAATLAGLASAEPETYELTFDDDKTDITVTVTTGSFFKAYVEFAAAPSVE